MVPLDGQAGTSREGTLARAGAAKAKRARKVVKERMIAVWMFLYLYRPRLDGRGSVQDLYVGVVECGGVEKFKRSDREFL